MTRSLAKLLFSDRAMLVVHLLCLAIAVPMVIFSPNKLFGLFGISLGLLAAVYFGYKMLSWRSLEILYPFAGILTITLAVISLFS